VRFSRALLPGIFAVIGCSFGQEPFQLSDVERLTVGESTRKDVERVLGAPSSGSPGSTMHESWTSTTFPPTPLSFIAWPIFLGRQGHKCTVTAWYTSENILSEGTVKLESSFMDQYVLVFVSKGLRYTLDERLLEPLHRAELKGFKIQIAEGDRHRSLRRYLEERNPSR
jgi:hypothetical protein